jgi:hypothetical protein
MQWYDGAGEPGNGFLRITVRNSGGDDMKKWMIMLVVGVFASMFLGGCQPAQDEGTTDPAATAGAPDAPAQPDGE